MDVVGTADVGLGEAEDAAIFEWARTEGRIIVTRNYEDFVPLVRAYANRGERFPGVLLIPPSVPGKDPGAHVRALEAWIERARTLGASPAESSLDWLT